MLLYSLCGCSAGGQPGSCDWYSLAGGVLEVLKSPVSTVQLFEVLVSTSPLGTGAGVLAWQGLPSGRESGRERH